MERGTGREREAVLEQGKATLMAQETSGLMG